MRSFLFLGLFLLLLGSCTPEENIIYVQFEQSQRLQANHDVLLKGVKIGEVTKVELTNKYKVLASVRLSDSVKLPKDSRFTISNKDLFTKSIIVEEGNWKIMLQNGDTIRGDVAENFFEKFDFKDSSPFEGLDKIFQ